MTQPLKNHRKVKWPEGVWESPFYHWLYHSIWLLHLYNTVKMQSFSPSFPLTEFIAKAFCRLFLWNFKEKSINHFLGHNLHHYKGRSPSPMEPHPTLLGSSSKSSLRILLETSIPSSVSRNTPFPIRANPSAQRRRANGP